MLFECGCSVTIQLRLCPTQKDLLVARNKQSEAVKGLGHAALSDSFVSFAWMVSTLKVDTVKAGEDLGLHFNGSPYLAAIHKAASSMGSMLSGPNGPVEKALGKVEMEYGRQILSSEYSKLSKLVAVVKSMVHSPGLRGPVETMAWLVEMLLLAFRVKLRAPSKATDQFLDKDRKTGVLGFWHASLVVLEVLGREYG